jgi:hypothetical protein
MLYAPKCSFFSLDDAVKTQFGWFGSYTAPFRGETHVHQPVRIHGLAAQSCFRQRIRSLFSIVKGSAEYGFPCQGDLEPVYCDG